MKPPCVTRAGDRRAVRRERAVEGRWLRPAFDDEADRRRLDSHRRERQALHALCGLTERAGEDSAAVSGEVDFDLQFHLRHFQGAFPVAGRVGGPLGLRERAGRQEQDAEEQSSTE